MATHEHNQLLKNIERVFVKIGLDQNFLKAARKHLDIMHKYFFKRENIRTKKELCITFLSKLFMDKLDMYPCKRKNACQVDEHFDREFKICPSEMFGQEKLSEAYRLACFFDCLKTGDLLDCKVAEVLNDEYRLRVIVKCGSPRLLCDLNITVSLPRNKLETSILKIPLEINEFIRVLVENEHATVDEEKLSPNKKNIKLGRINEMDLPHYVFKPPSNCLTLVEYLMTQPRLATTSSLNFILTSSGLDVKKHYSYYSNIDIIKNWNEPTGQVLLKEAETRDLNNYINLALTEQKNGNFKKAFEAIDEALEISKCSEVYLIRGEIHANLEKPRLSKTALLDLELAYKLDKSNLVVCRSLSSALSTAAIKFYKSKVYHKAVVAAEKALLLDTCNKNASALLKYLKNKYYPKNANCDQQQVGKEVIAEHQVDLSKVKNEVIDEQQE